MVKKVVAGVCLCFVFIMFACASLAAQGPQIAIVQRSPIVEPANGPEKGLTKIHSNLGSASKLWRRQLCLACEGAERVCPSGWFGGDLRSERGEGSGVYAAEDVGDGVERGGAVVKVGAPAFVFWL